jgi:hypothetical protein
MRPHQRLGVGVRTALLEVLAQTELAIGVVDERARQHRQSRRRFSCVLSFEALHLEKREFGSGLAQVERNGRAILLVPISPASWRYQSG